MILSLNLLKKIIDFNTNDIKEIERAFTDKVAEIDKVTVQGKGLEMVFVGQIKKISSHPDADKMQITETQVGDKIYRIVCGAKNIYEGQKVPVAMVGAILPGGFEIKEAIKRGVKSCGMICSEEELGLKDSSEGIMELSKDAPVGKNFCDYYGLDDVIFEIENTVITNRPDLFSHNSWAKEAIAIGIAKLKKDSIWLESNFDFVDKDSGEVVIKGGGKLSDFPLKFKFDKGVISRIQGIHVTGVKNGSSPKWVQDTLKAVNIRPISLLVDATNLAMVITGVPTHVFDLSKINGKEIKMRLSKDGEKVITLDKVERKLMSNVILMEDSKDIFDLCGIMGGKNSGVDEQTSDIWVHVPVYNPVLIRRASIALNHRSEASIIYEKKVPDSCVPYALECVLKIILEGSNAKISSKVFEYFPAKDHVVDPIKLSKSKIDSVIGDEIDSKIIEKILLDLGFEYSFDGKLFNVLVSKNRYKDVNIEEDLIEEIARIYGLSNIKSISPNYLMKISDVPNSFYLEVKIKEYLSSQGLFEVLNYAFLGDNLLSKCSFDKNSHVEISNPISEDLVKMRKSLLPYLIDNISKNKLQSEKFGVYEVGRVFGVSNGLIKEVKNLAFACFNYDYFEAKGIVESLFELVGISVIFIESRDVSSFFHPGQCADIIFQGSKIGQLGSSHPRIKNNFDIDKNFVLFEIDLDVLIKSNIKVLSYKEFSRFQGSKRDMNFVLDKKSNVYDFIRSLRLGSSELISDLKLIDVYEGKQVGEDNKSITLRISYIDKEKTITDEQVNMAHDKLVEKAKSLGAKFR